MTRELKNYPTGPLLVQPQKRQHLQSEWHLWPGVAFTHFVGMRTGLSFIVRLPNTPQYMIYRPLCQLLHMGTTRLDRAWDGFFRTDT